MGGSRRVSVEKLERAREYAYKTGCASQSQQPYRTRHRTPPHAPVLYADHLSYGNSETGVNMSQSLFRLLHFIISSSQNAGCVVQLAYPTARRLAACHPAGDTRRIFFSRNPQQRRYAKLCGRVLVG